MGSNTVVNGHKERGKYDTGTIYGILDGSLICHVAFSIDGLPYNMPMIPVRIDNMLYLHTSVKSRFYETLSKGTDACIAATLLDGIVLAKSAYNSSMNYRSTMVFGKLAPVTDPEEKLKASHKLTEKIAGGRWADCRRPSESELRATGFLKIPITTFSSKVREGSPIDNQEDLSLRHWSGVIPLWIARGEPVTSPNDEGRITLPGYLQD